MTAEGLCATCAHAVERHHDRWRTRARYPLVCLLTCKAVTERGIPRSFNTECYPCRYHGKADGYERRTE